MVPKSVQYVVLGVLGVVLAAVVWLQFFRVPDPAVAAPAGATPARTQAAAAGSRAQAPLAVPEVRLGALAAGAGGETVEIGRNLFRVQPKPVAPLASPATRQVEMPSTPPGPPPPPPPPPITLKLIGLVDAPGGAGKIAVLSDGRDVFYGREGDIIDGRYRVVRIGAESVDMSYPDGRGARTIPLSVP